jgi:hypothetical protein
MQQGNHFSYLVCDASLIKEIIKVLLHVWDYIKQTRGNTRAGVTKRSKQYTDG